MRRDSSFLLVLALASAGCGGKPPQPTAKPTTTTATTATVTLKDPPDTTSAAANDTVAGAAAKDTTAAKAPSPLEMDARAVVTAWLATQNEGNFDAYEKLYADKFIGVKRAGARERHFDRAGWMADRKKMFGAAMKVDADDVAVAASGRTVVVHLTQTWASGSFQDKGPKQLVLAARKGGGVAIAREEMLASELIAARAEAKPLAAEDFLFAVLVGHASAVLLPAAEFDLSWGKTPRLVRKAGPTVVVSDVDAGIVPPELKRWIGKEVELTNYGGAKCKGAIDGLLLVGQYTPHFGTVQRWDGADEVDDAGKPTGKVMTEDEIARDAWDSGQMDIRLAGRVASGCIGHWARDPSRPAVTPLASGDEDEKLEKAAIAEMRKLAGWKAVAEEAKAYPDQKVPAPWDELERQESGGPTVQLYEDATSGRAFAVVVANVGTGCGGFSGSFSAIFEVKDAKRKPAFVLLTDPAGGPDVGAIEFAVDLDGDGDVEFFNDDSMVQRAGASWRQTLDVRPPYLDCPC